MEEKGKNLDESKQDKDLKTEEITEEVVTEVEESAAPAQEPEATEAVIAKQTTPETTEPKNHAKCCNKSKSTAAITMSIIALILGCGGLALGWMGYSKSSTPLTFLTMALTVILLILSKALSPRSLKKSLKV